MGKYDTDDIGKPGKPPKVRRFPWRLWLWALVMTAAAGAGGYFTWHFKQEADAATTNESTTLKKFNDQQTALSTASKDAADCKSVREQLTKANTELDTQQKELSKNLNASKEELTALRAQRAETEKRMAAIEDIQKQFAKMIDTGTMKVTSRRGSLVLSLPAEVLFPSGVAELSEDGKLKVLEVGITLKKFKDRRFLVIGHSDNQPLKNSVFKDNWELSTARALTVTRFLVQAGMDPKNLLPAGSGEHDPIAPNSSAKEMARNRRIEIALLPAINELPPLPASITGEGDTKPADAKAEPKKP
ncbi:MAG TPA: flagellar motor protein MotB [Kofleriaceae bacterium]|nr:flagellar motor protein MotB [Kofleriaceae bacterium]